MVHLGIQNAAAGKITDHRRRLPDRDADLFTLLLRIFAVMATRVQRLGIITRVGSIH